MTDLEFKPYIKQRMAVKEIVDITQAPAKADRSLWRLEKYVGGNGEQRELHRINSEEGKALNAEVFEAFGINPQADFDTKAIGKLIPDNIITVRAPEGYFLSPDGLMFASVKFYMNDVTACVKGYKLYLKEEVPDLPQDIEILVMADYAPLGNLAFPEELKNCYDIFFIGDHDKVCSFFGKSLPEGKYMTGYGVRFKNGALDKVKSYVYDDPSPQSQWIGITQMHRMVYRNSSTTQQETNNE